MQVKVAYLFVLWSFLGTLFAQDTIAHYKTKPILFQQFHLVDGNEHKTGFNFKCDTNTLNLADTCLGQIWFELEIFIFKDWTWKISSYNLSERNTHQRKKMPPSLYCPQNMYEWALGEHFCWGSEIDGTTFLTKQSQYPTIRLGVPCERGFNLFFFNKIAYFQEYNLVPSANYKIGNKGKKDILQNNGDGVPDVGRNHEYSTFCIDTTQDSITLQLNYRDLKTKQSEIRTFYLYKQLH